MKDANYIVVQGWMTNRLKLSGNDLLVYAVIYGFSQDGKSKFEGSGKYIADSLGITRKAVILILKKLLDKEYILKFDKTVNGCVLRDYQANPRFIPQKDGRTAGNENAGGNNENSEDSSNDSAEDDSNEGREKFTQGVKNLHRVGNNYTGCVNITQGGKNLPRVGNNFPDAEKITHHKTLDINLDKAAAAFPPEEIKNAILAIDSAFVFLPGFYFKASSFLYQNKLDTGYLSWLYKQCESLKPDKIDRLFYSLFFAEDMLEKYKISLVPKPPPPVENVACPACGFVHARLDDKCPFCSLPDGSGLEEINKHRGLLALSPEKRGEYLQREDVIYREYGFDFNRPLNALKKEFGLRVSDETPSGSYGRR